MMMMKSVFWWRKPEYPEETTDLRQVTDEKEENAEAKQNKKKQEETRSRKRAEREEFSSHPAEEADGDELGQPIATHHLEDSER